MGMAQTTLLNLANIVDRTTALGPGLRAGIWVQGCNLHCNGCISPEWIPFRPATQLTPEQVIERLHLDEITGITLSGGEPMEQAAGLAEFIRLARRKYDLDVICFTGYRYEALLKKPLQTGVYDLLKVVDVLIDGPYISGRNNAIGLRGSTNQRILHLTNRLREHQLEYQERKVEFQIDHGSLTMVGIPTPAIVSALTEVLHAQTDSRAL